MKRLLCLGAVLLGLVAQPAFAMTDNDYLDIARASTTVAKAGQTDIITPVGHCQQPSLSRLSELSNQLTDLEAQADQGAASASGSAHVRWLNLARDIRFSNENLVNWATGPLPDFCYVAPGA